MNWGVMKMIIHLVRDLASCFSAGCLSQNDFV